MKGKVYIGLACLFIMSICACHEPSVQSFENWDTYLGDHASSQFSTIDEINKRNVGDLKLAWSFDGGESHPKNRSQIQCNPLVINGIVYATTATQKLVAIDGKTGKSIWSFDPYESSFSDFGMGVNRGLMWHEDADFTTLFYATGRYIMAIDPANGTIRESFGKNGRVDLQKGLGSNDDYIVLANTPGVIFKNKLIIGGRVSESTAAAAGHIRAFNVLTGEQEWIFHTLPKKGEEGRDTWPKRMSKTIGGANVWTGMALDKENGIVYCPTGSASYDFYGGNRHGDNLYANCLIALDADTGKRKWHFQFVHHDLWDKDLPTPPNLVDITKDGKRIPAVFQATKYGQIFAFNRITGEPIYDIVERKVPPSKLYGEKASPTQPFSVEFPKFSKTKLTRKNLNKRSKTSSDYAHAVWKDCNKAGGIFAPPSEEGTLIFPGFDGGAEWGGAAVDKEENNLIINSNEIPWLMVMDKIKPATQGQQVYQTNCQNCHGEKFEGNKLYGNVPSLKNLSKRMNVVEAMHIIRNGQGIMPAFEHLDKDKIENVVNYINGIDSTALSYNEDWPYPYAMRGYTKLYAPDGYPINKPPWGQLSSIDLENAKINWQIPLGNHDELNTDDKHNTGTENYGGPIVTAGGLIFIASTMDEKIRAFDKSSGKELWSHKLPAAGYATPASYAIDGKQYIIIACGGGKLGTKSSDKWLAFALP